jgi:hypothetical protein
MPCGDSAKSGAADRMIWKCKAAGPLVATPLLARLTVIGKSTFLLCVIIIREFLELPYCRTDCIKIQNYILYDLR